MLQKLSSRKFIVAAIGVLSGVVLCAFGDITEGVTAIVTSAVAYLAAEGIIDAVAVKKQFIEIAENIKEDEHYDGYEEDGCGLSE